MGQAGIDWKMHLEFRDWDDGFPYMFYTEWSNDLDDLKVFPGIGNLHISCSLVQSAVRSLDPSRTEQCQKCGLVVVM